jgi:hypothetical protein
MSQELGLRDVARIDGWVLLPLDEDRFEEELAKEIGPEAAAEYMRPSEKDEGEGRGLGEGAEAEDPAAGSDGDAASAEASGEAGDDEGGDGDEVVVEGGWVMESYDDDDDEEGEYADGEYEDSDDEEDEGGIDGIRDALWLDPEPQPMAPIARRSIPIDVRRIDRRIDRPQRTQSHPRRREAGGSRADG